jgi:ABC-type transporter Mla MlaB component
LRCNLLFIIGVATWQEIFIMWMVQILKDGEVVVFRLSGRLEDDQLIELQKVFEAQESKNIWIDLSDVKLIDRETVSFLAERERDGAQLKNCPVYIREWIIRQNEGK